MVRYELFGLGATWTEEYGTAGDPEQLGWLLGYSPYHRVVDGTAYPAVLFTVFDGDTRVDPLHARKLCAALQHATVRRDPPGAGAAGDATSATAAGPCRRSVELSADTLAFTAAPARAAAVSAEDAIDAGRSSAMSSRTPGRCSSTAAPIA